MANDLTIGLDCAGVPASLVAISATVTEAISRPTSAAIELVGADDVDLEGAIGAKATLSFAVDGEIVRRFHLVVREARFEGLIRDARRRYTIELVHELALLELRSDVRIFQDQDAKDVVAAVLAGAGIESATTWSVKRSLAKRTYCVQYRETDLNFASRLLEHEGIFYFARDDEGGSTLTFGDAQSAFAPIDGAGGGDTCPIQEGRGHGTGIFEFVLESVATPEAATVGDYNFEAPAVDLTVTEPAADSPRGETFEYAAGHTSPAEGQAIARVRMEEIIARSRIGTGHGDRWTFAAGATFEIEGAVAPHLAQRYLLTSVTHRVVLREGRGEGGRDYENTFVCMPHALAYRPPRTAVRPRLRGVHAAVVTGPGGEIHTDKHGRMKGKFFWDRVSPDDDTSSCWMRVGQFPIGGSMALARMTWEMGVVYFDGDPDRPVALWRLYNAEKASPYGYPAAKTRMSFQTASSPASGKSNELRMEDGGGGQEMFVNASKDFDGLTNNNKTEKVGADETIQVGVDASVTVGASETVTIGGSLITSVSANQGTQVTGGRTVSIGGSESSTVSGSIDQKVAGSDTETTGGSHTTMAALGVSKTSTGSFTLNIGGSLLEAAGMGVSFAVAGARSETVGAAKIFASGAAVTETTIGAYASTVGGVCVQAAAGNFQAATKGVAAVTVGGAVIADAAGKVTIKAPTISMLVGGTANFFGAGGDLNLTPASAALGGMVSLDASGTITISGNPNLVG